MTTFYAGMDELERFIREHPGCTYIELMVPDMSGQLRGKRLSPKAARKLFGEDAEGVRLPGSNYLLDATGRNIDGLEYGGADGDPDFFCHAVPGSLAPVPWAAESAGQVLASMADAAGRPHFADPRHVLACVMDRLDKLGLRAVMAIELEFHLIDAKAMREGRIEPARLPLSGRRPGTVNVYGLDDLGEFSALFADIAQTCAAQGLDAETAVSEYGPGQYEINLLHRADALAACDQAVLLKRAIKACALRHGAIATFMAKPFAGQAGNGLHVHVSLVDEAGVNIFSGQDQDGRIGRAISARMKQAIAGLVATMGEGMAIFAPNANSYRRLRPGTYAPVSAIWGGDNRTLPIRIPGGDDADTRIEHRVAGADASPYLVAAAVLAGIHHGLVHELEPPAPVAGDGYEQGGAPLPLFWPEALKAFAGGGILGGYFDAEWRRAYLAARWQELQEHHFTIPQLDYDWYLTTA